MKKTALILLAHGSKDKRWQKPFEELLHSVKKENSSENIFLAYLDFCLPSLFDIVESIYDKCDFIEILPLFMAGGGHVDNDIPKIINQLKEKYPKIKIEILSPIGENPKSISAFKEIILESKTNMV